MRFRRWTTVFLVVFLVSHGIVGAASIEDGVTDSGRDGNSTPNAPTVGATDGGRDGQEGNLPLEDGSTESDGTAGQPQEQSGGAKTICDSAGEAKQTCIDCMGTGAEVTGVWTAIGCISTQPAEAAGQIFNLALGIGGVFILVQILLGAFGLITSSGNPSSVEKAKKRITDSVIALLFLVFSVALLELIGMQILQLPGLADPGTGS